MKIQVVRAFLIKGERQEPASVLEVSNALAAELIHAGKAVAVDAIAKAGPMTTVSASEIVSGARAKKGKE